jgi:hypothetical protein
MTVSRVDDGRAVEMWTNFVVATRMLSNQSLAEARFFLCAILEVAESPAPNAATR